MISISENTKLIRHSNAIAAGQTTVTPASGVDVTGFAGCLFLVHWGTIVATGVQSAEVHTSSDDGVGDAFTALAGSKVVVADDDDNKITWIDVRGPVEKFLKCIINRGTADSTIDGISAIVYGAPTIPQTQAHATISGGKLLISAAEGVA